MPVTMPLIWSKHSPLNSKEFRVRKSSVRRNREDVLTEGQTLLFQFYLEFRWALWISLWISMCGYLCVSNCVYLCVTVYVL